MKGVLMLLKALGVELTEEQAVMIQEFIPMIPAKVNEVIQMNVACLKSFDDRLKVIEATQHEILVMLQDHEVRDVQEAASDLTPEQNVKLLAYLNSRFTQGAETNAETKPGRFSGSYRNWPPPTRSEEK